MLPVGASVCVAGSYVSTVTEPVILGKIVAFSKRQILEKYQYPFLIYTLGQLVFGGIAIYTGQKLDEIRRKKRLIRNRYSGNEVEAGRECKICLTNPCDVIFDPCKHMCCCKACAGCVRDCPVCRAYIRGRTGVFLT